LEYSKEDLNKMVTNQQLSSSELEALLKARQEGKIEFKLIDIREVYEFTDRSIVGADLLYPTTIIQKFVPDFEAMKDEPVILYCRTGSRTGQIMYALTNMGMTNIVHLCDGILSYRGETVSRADVPNEL
jgi:rhodanese-related sulfurtransferase